MANLPSFLSLFSSIPPVFSRLCQELPPLSSPLWRFPSPLFSRFSWFRKVKDFRRLSSGPPLWENKVLSFFPRTPELSLDQPSFLCRKASGPLRLLVCRSRKITFSEKKIKCLACVSLFFLVKYLVMDFLLTFRFQIFSILRSFLGSPFSPRLPPV